MNKITVFILRIYGLIISALLTLLGFTCGFAPEYGTPRATYEAKGIVMSEADVSPIEGIQAELVNKSDFGTIATAYTDSEGSFFLKGDSFPRNKLHVILTDIDREENGSFIRMEVEADYTNKTFTGSSGNWYRGKAAIDLGIIKMKTKRPAETDTEDSPPE